jgi:hypothetical protein
MLMVPTGYENMLTSEQTECNGSHCSCYLVKNQTMVIQYFEDSFLVGCDAVTEQGVPKIFEE